MPAENTKLLPCPICGTVPKIRKKWYRQHQKFCYGTSCCFLNLDNSLWDFWTVDDLAKAWNRRAEIKEVVTTGVQQLKAEIAKICTVIDIAESGLVTVDYASLKRRLRQLSAI